MFFLVEAIVVGRYFSLRRLGQQLRHQEPWQLFLNQSAGVAGFSVKWNPQSAAWEVGVVHPDTPASREPRLQENTTILQVNGQKAKHLKLRQLKDIIHGPPDSTLQITVKTGSFFFGTKTLLLNRAAPNTLFNALLCFGLQSIRRRLGSCALVAMLTAKLTARLTLRREQHFDEAVLRRVFGGRIIDAIAGSARAEMLRMLHARALCPFMVTVQVNATF